MATKQTAPWGQSRNDSTTATHQCKSAKRSAQVLAFSALLFAGQAQAAVGDPPSVGIEHEPSLDASGVYVSPLDNPALVVQMPLNVVPRGAGSVAQAVGLGPLGATPVAASREYFLPMSWPHAM